MLFAVATVAVDDAGDQLTVTELRALENTTLEVRFTRAQPSGTLMLNRPAEEWNGT